MKNNARPHFTQREEQLIRLLAEEGLMNQEIANRLQLTQGTVKVYFGRIFRKLGLEKSNGRSQARIQLVIWYWRHQVSKLYD